MSYRCSKCSHEIPLSVGARVGRRDSCPQCGADLHSCLHCVHHDRSAYNECREPQAERVLDKERSNMCDYFTPYTGPARDPKGKGSTDYLKGLDDLFKPEKKEKL